MSDRICLKCGGPLADHERCICGQCFFTIPRGLRLEWRNARDERGRLRVIAKVKALVMLSKTKELTPEVAADLALGQRRIKEMKDARDVPGV